MRIRLRTVFILVTVTATYAACWNPTVQQGTSDVRQRVAGEQRFLTGAVNCEPVMPMIVKSEFVPFFKGAPTRRYHFWLFGYVTELP